MNHAVKYALMAIGVAAILSPAASLTSAAAVYNEPGFDVGESLPTAGGPVWVPDFTNIQGVSPDLNDVDLYSLSFRHAGQARLTITGGHYLFLFSETGHPVMPPARTLTFHVDQGDTYYLGLSIYRAALDGSGNVLLDPDLPAFVGTGALARWEPRMSVIQIPYRYQVEVIPEPSLAWAAPAAAVLVSLLRRQRRP